MRVRTSALLLLATACTAPVGGVELLVPDDVEFTWNAAYDLPSDGLVALIPLDVMVYGAFDGLPTEGAVVTLSADAVGFLAAEAISAADPACVDCVWDAYRDAYVDVRAEEAAAPLEVVTDASGLARVHALVDAIGSGGTEPIEVRVQLGEQERVLLLLPR